MGDISVMGPILIHKNLKDCSNRCHCYLSFTEVIQSQGSCKVFSFFHVLTQNLRTNFQHTLFLSVYLCSEVEQRKVLKLAEERIRNPAWMVLPLSRAVCNVTMRIGDCMYRCWILSVFCSKQKAIFFHSPILSFAYTASYYAYKMAKCIYNVPEVQNFL